MTDSTPKETLDQKALSQLFGGARTYNAYHDRAVSSDQLNMIWELMKYGPTSANCLPARMIWCTTEESKTKLAALTMAGNDKKIMSAPVSVIIGMDLEFYEHLPELFPHADAKSWFDSDPENARVTAFRNSSLQGAYFIMAARAIGLDTGAMSGFDNDGVDKEFFGGTTIKSNFISTLGYGDESSIFDRSPRPAFDRFNTIL